MLFGNQTFILFTYGEMIAIIYEFNGVQYVSATTYAKLREENRKLKERIDELEKCNLNLQEWLDNKEKVNKSLREELSAYDREYFDEDKKAKNIFKEDDTYVYNAKQVRDIC